MSQTQRQWQACSIILPYALRASLRLFKFALFRDEPVPRSTGMCESGLQTNL